MFVNKCYIVRFLGKWNLKKKDGKGYICKVVFEVNLYLYLMNMYWKWFNYLIVKYYIYIYVYVCFLELWNKVILISNSY